MGRPGYLSSFHEFPKSIDHKLFLGGTNQAKRRRILSSQNAAPDIFPKNRQNASGSGQRSENVLDSHSVSHTESEAGIRRFVVPKHTSDRTGAVHSIGSPGLRIQTYQFPAPSRTGQPSTEPNMLTASLLVAALTLYAVRRLALGLLTGGVLDELWFARALLELLRERPEEFQRA